MKKTLTTLLAVLAIIGISSCVIGCTKNTNGNTYKEHVAVLDSKDIEKTLISEYWQEVLGGSCSAQRISEIANEDKDVEYIAVINEPNSDKQIEVPFSEVPISMNVWGYGTVTAKDGKITCYVYFEESKNN